MAQPSHSFWLEVRPEAAFLRHPRRRVWPHLRVQQKWTGANPTIGTVTHN
jgi:hypothetical protein